MSNQRDINNISNTTTAGSPLSSMSLSQSFTSFFSSPSKRKQKIKNGASESNDINFGDKESTSSSTSTSDDEGQFVDNSKKRINLIKSILKNSFVCSIIFGYVRNTISSTIVPSVTSTTTIVIGKRYNEIFNIEWMTSNRHFSLLKYKLDRKESLYGWSTTCFVSLLKYCRDWELVVQLLRSSKYVEHHRQLPVFDHAAANQSLELISYLHKHSYKATSDAVDTASAHGNFEVVQFLSKHKYPATKAALNAAASAGHLEVVSFLTNNRTEGASKLALDEAASNGHLEVVKYLLANRTEGGTSTAVDCASLEGHYEIVVQLLSAGLKGTQNALDWAASKGNLGIVEYLARYQQPCSVSAMNGAATNGHMSVLEYLHHNRSEGCTVTAMNGASAQGHLECVKFLHSQRTEGCTSTALSMAAVNGHIHVAEFLHYNRMEGCSKDVIEECAKFSRNLPVIKFLLEQRSERFTSTALRNSAEFGNLEILKYLAIKYMERNNEILNSSNNSSNNGDLTNTQVTNNNENINKFKFRIQVIAARGYLEILKFFADHQLATDDSWSVDCLNQACQFGQMDVVRYLHETRTEGCTVKALDGAILNGHLQVVRFLLEHRAEQFTPAEKEQAILCACRVGKVEMVQLLQEQANWLANQKCFDDASVRGHIKVIKYLYSRDSDKFSIDKSLSYAIANDQFDITDYLDRIKKQKRSKMSSSAGSIITSTTTNQQQQQKVEKNNSNNNNVNNTQTSNPSHPISLHQSLIKRY